jgi:hypothetical protein
MSLRVDLRDTFVGVFNFGIRTLKTNAPSSDFTRPNSEFQAILGQVPRRRVPGSGRR